MNSELVYTVDKAMRALNNKESYKKKGKQLTWRRFLSVNYCPLGKLV